MTTRTTNVNDIETVTNASRINKIMNVQEILDTTTESLTANGVIISLDVMKYGPSI